MKILIVCTGNSCRSQMAQGWLQSFDKNLNVCSAGTEPAEEVNPLAIKTMKSSGIDISHHTPKSIHEYLNEPWDYVITVCGEANENCPVFNGKVRQRLHIGFYDPSRAQGTPEFIESEFRRICNQIKTKMYDFYTDEILNGDGGPTCTCGANRFCRCN
ncbi:arsenate reductase ArsC [Parabacteroides goldsteinii]|nr:arsenate reductase ArsC [Parabacteroides goldsteinii]